MTTQLRVLLTILVVLGVGYAAVIFGGAWVKSAEAKDRAAAMSSIDDFEAPAGWRERRCDAERCFTTRTGTSPVADYVSKAFRDEGFEIADQGSTSTVVAEARHSMRVVGAIRGRAKIAIGLLRGPYLGEPGTSSFASFCDRSKPVAVCLKKAPRLTEVRFSLVD